MTRVLVWPAGDPDRDATAFYRLTEPARVLAAQGADVHVDTTGPRAHWDRRWDGDHAPLDAHVIGCDRPDADIVVLQRPGRRHWAQTIPHLQAHGVRVVVDIDDHFAAIPAGNIARDHYDPARSPHHNHRWITEACRLADLVTVTTPALGRHYGGHGRVAVLPNLVPESYLTVDVERLPQTVGWTGSTRTHPRDLQSTAGGIARALTATGWRAYVVGTGLGVREALRLDHDPIATGWVPIPDYPAATARAALGVVPLAIDRFNRGKSALKMIEMAALGVPVVASPTPDNLRMAEVGVGWIARTGTEWETRLRLLIDNEQARADLAGRGRAVMAGWTYEQWADLWWCAWERTLATKAA